MSLAALLNKEEASPSQRQNFIKRLNQEFKVLGVRDVKEQRYQDWKMLSYQEFELVTEWNNQSRELGSNGCERLMSNMESTKHEWDQFQEYAARKDDIVRQQRALRLKQQQEQEQERLQQEKERQELLEQERALKKAHLDQDNHHNDKAAVQAKSESKNHKILNGTSDSKSKAGDIDGDHEGDEDEDDDEEEDEIEDINVVSYTHLDVYKRQG